MVLFEIFVIGRGGGRTPQTTRPVGRIPRGEQFGQLPSGKFATKAAAERAVKALRAEIADRDTPVGVRAVPTPQEQAAFPRTKGGAQISGPPKSERGRQLKRQRERKELGEQAIEKARKGVPISRAEREAAKRLTRTDVQPVSETARLQKALRPRVTPRTREEVQRSLRSRQEQLALTRKIEVAKIKPITTTKPTIKSVLTLAPQPTSLVEKIEAKRQRLSFQAQFRSRDQPFKRQALSFGAVGFAAAAVPIALVTQPVQFVKGTFQLGKQIITQPGATGLAFGATLRREPELVVGTIIGSIATGKGLQQTLKLPFIPKPAKGKIEIPTAGEALTLTTFGLRTGTRGLPLVTRTPTGVRFGRTDITPELSQLKPGADVKIGGPLETSLVKKALEIGPRVTARARQIISPARRILLATRRVKPKKTKLPVETERLGPKGTKIVLDIARQEEAVVFGSFARKAQNPAGALPRDIDIRLDRATDIKIETVAKRAVSRLRGAGIPARLRVDTPGAVEVKRGRVFEKAVEFKGKQPIADEELVPEQILGLQKVGKPVKISKQRFTGLPEELRGVTQGVIRVKKKGGLLDIGPPPKRVKDIGSLLETSTALAQQKLIRSPALESDISKIGQLFGRGTKDIPATRRIADFGRPFPKPSPKRVPRAQQAVSPAAVLRKTPSPLSPVARVSPRVSISARPSTRPSPRISPAISVSPFPSPKPSPSVSPFPKISPRPSPSPIGKLPSAFPSPSLSPARSISTSLSPSPSVSPTPGVSFGPPLVTPFLPSFKTRIQPPLRKGKKQKKRKFRGAPSLSVVLGFPGKQLTAGQIAGTEFISPLTIRQVRRRV